jgi:hypothetical protein
MPDCGAPVRIVTYYVVEFLAVYMLMSLWYSGCDVCTGSVVCLAVLLKKCNLNLHKVLLAIIISTPRIATAYYQYFAPSYNAADCVGVYKQPLKSLLAVRGDRYAT